MNVADLAKELGVPPSTLLDQCQQVGIESAWAGTELTEIQQISLRSQLVDRNLVPRAARERADRVLPPAAPLPPTAVGSLPGFLDQVEAPGAVATVGGAGSFAGDDPRVQGRNLGGVDTETLQRDVVTHAGRRLDHSVRPAFIAMVIALAALIGSNFIDHPVAILGLWILAAVSLVVALVSANRARYRITTHPEKHGGLVISVGILGVALVTTVMLAMGVWTVVRSAPAAKAPLSIGDQSPVQILRWNYQRVLTIKEAGWQRPAKDAGTCWTIRSNDAENPRRAHRVEIGSRDIDCEAEHDVEVLGVYRVNQDADVAYPGVARLQAYAMDRCTKALDNLVAGAPANPGIQIEYPTQQGWADGDHDVACVAVLARTGSLLAG